VNITSIVYNVIIYSSPCYLFMGGINDFLKKFISYIFSHSLIPKEL
jgi:hypothetical protein